MRTHIALIRGINVGGNNLIKMAELRLMLADLGLADAQTLLQSGNVTFSSAGRTRAELEEMLASATEERFRVKPDYFVRTTEEWHAIIRDNPFPDAAANDPSHFVVALLKSPPIPGEVEALQEAIQGPELVKAGSEHLYIVYPIDIGNSKVGKTPGWNKIVAPGTARNWNTVLKLATLASS